MARVATALHNTPEELIHWAYITLVVGGPFWRAVNFHPLCKSVGLASSVQHLNRRCSWELTRKHWEDRWLAMSNSTEQRWGERHWLKGTLHKSAGNLNAADILQAILFYLQYQRVPPQNTVSMSQTWKTFPTIFLFSVIFLWAPWWPWGQGACQELQHHRFVSGQGPLLHANLSLSLSYLYCILFKEGIQCPKNDFCKSHERQS